MIESLRAMLRAQLSNLSCLRRVRRAQWSIRARRDSAAVSAISKKLGLQILDFQKFSFADQKPSHTLFILGSGSSVLELTRQNFAEIREHVSVGINVWAAHDFIPDAYSLESGGLPISQLDSRQRTYLGEQLSRPEVLKKLPQILLLRPAAPSISEQFPVIPEPLRARTHIYGRANLPHVRSEIAQDEIKRFLRGFLRRREPLPVLPDNGASVVRLTFLGLMLGFKKIVLVGIDLNRNPYFWFADKWRMKRPELGEIFPRTIGKPHETTEATDRPFNTADVIRWIANGATASGASEILTGSTSSALADFLPVYPWKE